MVVGTNLTHNYLPLQFLSSLGFIKGHLYSILDMATFNKENEGGLKGHNKFILFVYCFICFVISDANAHE